MRRLRSGFAAHHVVAGNHVDQFAVGIDNIRLCPKRIPAGVVAECFLELKVGHFVAAGVIIEHSVEADGFLCNNRGAYDKFGLECAGGADAHHVERAAFGAHLAG